MIQCPGGGQPQGSCNQGCPSGTSCQQGACCPSQQQSRKRIIKFLLVHKHSPNMTYLDMCNTGVPPVCPCNQGCPQQTQCQQNVGCCPQPQIAQPPRKFRRCKSDVHQCRLHNHTTSA